MTCGEDVRAARAPRGRANSSLARNGACLTAGPSARLTTTSRSCPDELLAALMLARASLAQSHPFVARYEPAYTRKAAELAPRLAHCARACGAQRAARSAAPRP